MAVNRGIPRVSDGIIMALDFGSPRGGTPAVPVNLIDPTNTQVGNNMTESNGLMVFNGTTAFIDLDPTVIESLEGTAEATVEFWLKANLAANGAGQAGLLQMSGYNATNGTLYLYSNQSIYLDFFRINRMTVSTNTTSWFDATKWHHLSVSTTPGTAGWRVMINGVHRYNTTGNPTVTVINPVYDYELGRNSGSREFGGEMGQMVLYNRALSDAEKIQNYEAGKSRYGL